MGRPCTFVLTRDFLYQKYTVEHLGILEIARLVHCRNGDVIDALKAFGLHQPNSYVTREWMIEHYINQQETVDEIATRLGCKEENVRKYLRNFGIPIRYRSRGSIRRPELNDHVWLTHHYVTLGMSGNEIADMLCARPYAVYLALHRAGIECRLTGHTQGTYQRRQRIFTTSQRRRILARDGNRCRMPNCTNTEELEAHHIVPAAWGGTNTIDNGITLCQSCHHSIKTREAQYMLLFLLLVSEQG